jgi:hypothetical protein
MKAVSLVMLILAGATVASEAQNGQSPYAGQEGRGIKSLSPDEVRKLLDGDGMGLAKAAELNGYPGPKHVIELAGPLQLTPAQLAATEATFRKMRSRAKEIGARIVQREQALDALFAGKSVTAEALARSVQDIGSLQGELRAVHLEAHLTQLAILTPLQTSRYRGLRGYGGTHATHDHAHSH